MSVDLRPLLTGFIALSDALRQLRLDKPVTYLLPEQADPGLADPLPHASCSQEAHLRGRMLACAAQLRAVGLRDAVRATLLLDGVTPAQRALLLAAPGFAAWLPDGRRLWDPRSRSAEGGLVYRLETALGPAARHAEHAASHLTQSLYLAAPDQPMAQQTLIVPAVRSACLSLQCALRDVVVGLLRDGQEHLATQAARIGGLHPLVYPATAVTRPQIAAAG